jgi:hypothetical protein
MSEKNTTDKMIPNPENPEEEIENPDYIEPEEEEEEEEEDLSPELSEKVKALVAKETKRLKAMVDRAYTERDEALKAQKLKEQEARDAETAKLKEEGKLAEAHERELADRDAEISALQERLVKLTRDNEVRDLLAGYEFRTARAAKNAQRDIVEELVQNDKGEWQHKSGTSIAKFVEAFFKEKDNEFYLKPKTNKGGGFDQPKKPDTDSKKSVFDMSQDEVLKRAAERVASQRTSFLSDRK